MAKEHDAWMAGLGVAIDRTRAAAVQVGADAAPSGASAASKKGGAQFAEKVPAGPREETAKPGGTKKTPLTKPKPIPVKAEDLPHKGKTGGKDGGGAKPDGAAGKIPADAGAGKPADAKKPADDGGTKPGKPAGDGKGPADDDDDPHLGVDVTGTVTDKIGGSGGVPNPAPVSLGVSVLYRNLTVKSWKVSENLKIELLHEPTFSLQTDGSSITDQVALSLVNVNWVPPWKKEIELSIQSDINDLLQPNRGVQAGLKAQLEAHLNKIDSITIDVSATLVPTATGEGNLEVVEVGYVRHWR